MLFCQFYRIYEIIKDLYKILISLVYLRKLHLIQIVVCDGDIECAMLKYLILWLILSKSSFSQVISLGQNKYRSFVSTSSGLSQNFWQIFLAETRFGVFANFMKMYFMGICLFEFCLYLVMNHFSSILEICVKFFFVILELKCSLL